MADGCLPLSGHAICSAAPNTNIGPDRTVAPTWHRCWPISVQPVFDAGLVDLVETDHRICEEIELIPTFGHTPGHVSVRITSRGEEALITGDFLHHPCQIAHPEWSSTADWDADQAHRTRLSLFASLAGRSVLVLGTHFAGATAGRIARDGEAFRLMV